MAKIKEIRCIRSRAGGHWVIVKVLTDQPGLWGIGSANDYHHSSAVVTAMDEVVAPRLIGRDPADIEDIWQSTLTSAYWRNSSILNVLLGGIDMALWDIKGKEAGMPVYQLLGGALPHGSPLLRPRQGATISRAWPTISSATSKRGIPWSAASWEGTAAGVSLSRSAPARPKNAWPASHVFDDEEYLATIPKMFEHLRGKLGFGPKLTHDVHEHLRPQSAVALSKLLEPYRLFFPRGRAAPGADRLVPDDPRAVHDPAGDG